MSSDKVLSQDEIDAMLAQTSGGGNSGFTSASAAPIDSVKPIEPRPPMPVSAASVEASQISEQGQSAGQSYQRPPIAAQDAPSQPIQPNRPSGLDMATQATINNLSAKMQTFDAAMERVVQLEKALYETNSTVRQLQQEFQSVSGQIQLVSSRLEGVLTNLKATLGYNAQKTFVCTNCHAKGEVAAEVKCTRCNKKNWWGWWPSKWR